MDDLFIPKGDEKDLERLITPENYLATSKGDDCLVVGGSRGIWVIPDFESEPVQFIEKRSAVDGLMFANGIYYCGGFGVYRDDKHIIGDVAISMCWHMGRIVYGHYGLKNQGDDDYFTNRDKSVLAVAFHKSKLYDASGDCIFVNDHKKKGRLFSRRKGKVMGMVQFDGKLYDAGYYGIYDTLKKSKVVDHDYWIQAICVHNGSLIHSNDHGDIFDSFSGDHLYQFAELDRQIYSMVSVPKKFFKSYYQKKLDFFL